MAAPFDLFDYLKKIPKEEIRYFPNIGNAGDSLIHCATLQVFKKCSVNFRYYRPGDSLGNKIFIYGGGGILVRPYQGGARLLKKILDEKPKKIIVLPHTFEGHEDLLIKMGKEADLICRDPVSFSHLRRLNLQAQLFLSEDLALYLDPQEILNENESRLLFLALCSGPFSLIRNTKTLLAYVRQLFVRRLRPNPPGEVLNAFRTDPEKTAKVLPKDNLDIAELARLGVFPEGTALLSAYVLFSMIRPYQTVKTNRLHVAIAAALLGKQVFLYPNNYFKVEAIFEYSLKRRFPQIQFVTD